MEPEVCSSKHSRLTLLNSGFTISPFLLNFQNVWNELILFGIFLTFFNMTHCFPYSLNDILFNDNVLNRVELGLPEPIILKG